MTPYDRMLKEWGRRVMRPFDHLFEQTQAQAIRRRIVKLQGELFDLRIHCQGRGADWTIMRCGYREVLREIKRLRAML